MEDTNHKDFLNMLEEEHNDSDNFTRWWGGIHIQGDPSTIFPVLPMYEMEQALITSDMQELTTKCPSLTKVGIAKFNDSNLQDSAKWTKRCISGRLTDGRYLFVICGQDETRVAIAPRCGPPLDAPWKEAQLQTNTIGRMFEAKNKSKDTLALCGCGSVLFVIPKHIRSMSELSEYLPF